MTLFDPGAPVEVDVVLSATQRITRRNAELLAAGRHPATLLPLWIGTGETCATCVHHSAPLRNTRRYHKCDHHHLGPSRSEASDIRVGWPACALYRPE